MLNVSRAWNNKMGEISAVSLDLKLLLSVHCVFSAIQMCRINTFF